MTFTHRVQFFVTLFLINYHLVTSTNLSQQKTRLETQNSVENERKNVGARSDAIERESVPKAEGRKHFLQEIRMIKNEVSAMTNSPFDRILRGVEKPKDVYSDTDALRLTASQREDSQFDQTHDSQYWVARFGVGKDHGQDVRRQFWKGRFQNEQKKDAEERSRENDPQFWKGRLSDVEDEEQPWKEQFEDQGQLNDPQFWKGRFDSFNGGDGTGRRELKEQENDPQFWKGRFHSESANGKRDPQFWKGRFSEGKRARHFKVSAQYWKSRFQREIADSENDPQFWKGRFSEGSLQRKRKLHRFVENDKLNS